jgi:hypothetical protein
MGSSTQLSWRTVQPGNLHSSYNNLRRDLTTILSRSFLAMLTGRRYETTCVRIIFDRGLDASTKGEQQNRCCRCTTLPREGGSSSVE